VEKGVEKIVSAHLAVRAELAVAFGISDHGISTAWLPSVGVSIPLGRYRKSPSPQPPAPSPYLISLILMFRDDTAFP